MIRQLSPLEKLAVIVAIIPPAQRSQHAVSASIPWETVEQIRAELEVLGYDWRTPQKESRARGKRR